MTAAFARAYHFEGEKNTDEVKKKLLSANPGTIVQAIRPGNVRNEAFIEMLAAQTFAAESSGSLLAKKREIDLLLRLAGTTQISRAIREEGARPGQDFLAINAGTSKLVAPLGYERRELTRDDLTKAELVKIERAALLDARRG
jgi:tRNA threonylcarbamoyladenosine modification (KEOPS) complex Cgi121 subunit